LIGAVWLLVGLTACKPPEDPIDCSTNPNQEGCIVEENKLFARIDLLSENPKVNETIEFALVEETAQIKSLGNPFDYDFLKVMAVFTTPSATEVIVPAFWYHDYTITLNTSWPGNPTGISGRASTDPNEPQGLETIVLSGDPHYRIRLRPSEAGLHQYQIIVTLEGIIVQIEQGSFLVSEGEVPYSESIRIEPNHKRNFIQSDGSLFLPIGQNLGWYTSSTRQSYDYDVWFAKMNEAEANFARIWMATWSFCLHWGNKFDDFSSKMNAAARLDRVLGLAAEYDIQIMLTLLNHGQFSATVNPQWHNNPWNSANGGILDYPSLFFTSHEAKRVYKNQLMYLIGRYAHNTHLFAWELWNEVDWTDNFSSTAVYMWHIEMAQFLKAHDPYKHMVTTSYKGSTGGAYASPSIDFANPHSYDYGSKSLLNELPPVLDHLFSTYQKPIFQSEIGINWQSGSQTASADPTGIALKQQLWAGMMGGGAGGAMNWWWDSFVHPNDLYHRFTGPSRFSKLLDLDGSDIRQLRTLFGTSVGNIRVNLIGYRVDSRIYGYLYDNTWRYNNTTLLTKQNVAVEIPLSNGTYQITFYNTDTGAMIQTNTLAVSSGKAVFTAPSFMEDIAFIIE